MERARCGWACPPGSGKTALAATYVDARRRVSGWYQLDERDADLATFFYYLGLLARQIAPAHRTSLQVFTATFRRGAPVFARRFFESFFQLCPRPFVFVLDDYDALPATAPLHHRPLARRGGRRRPGGARHESAPPAPVSPVR